ncbi:MAG: hypothetical protein IJH07_04000 [Ruminococcus sp.]|nr:hypothetical protein [Ruminococcus sp.]
MKEILLSLCLSLILTLAVELTLALLLKVRSGKDLFIIALANLLTNPAVNYGSYWAFYLFGTRSVYTVLIVAALETAAVFIEFLIYRRLLSFDRIGKLRLSILLNGASFLAGVAVSAVMTLFASK